MSVHREISGSIVNWDAGTHHQSVPKSSIVVQELRRKERPSNDTAKATGLPMPDPASRNKMTPKLTGIS